MKYLPYIIIAALLLLAGLFWCNRHPEPTTTTGEVARQQVYNPDSIRHVAYQEKDAEYRPQIKTLERKLAALEAQLPLIQKKARESAATFVKTGAVEDCKTALNDCQEEAQTAVRGLVLADSIITKRKEQRQADSTEIAAGQITKQELNAGWAAANGENAVLQKKLTKEKGKRWSVGVQAGYGVTPIGHGPTVSIGIQRTLFKF